MAPKLEALRAPDVGRNIEPAGDGFVIVRPSDADRDVFNDLVRDWSRPPAMNMWRCP